MIKNKHETHLCPICKTMTLHIMIDDITSKFHSLGVLTCSECMQPNNTIDTQQKSP
jgi:formate dehydrogenase maturation protein FdhE